MLEQEKLKQNIGMALQGALGNEELGQMTDKPLLWKKALTQWNLQDAYKEPEEENLPPEEKAHRDMSNMSPQDIIALSNTVQGAGT